MTTEFKPVRDDKGDEVSADDYDPRTPGKGDRKGGIYYNNKHRLSGYLARETGIARNQNPHKEKTTERSDWHEGWDDHHYIHEPKNRDFSMPITSTKTQTEKVDPSKPKSIHKKCKTTATVQDARGTYYSAGTEIDLITDFGGTYQAKLPNGSSIYCGPSVLDLASVVDFAEEAPTAVVKVETAPAQEMLSGDDLKVGKGSEKAKEQQAIRKYRDARYLYSSACQAGAKAVESAIEKWINDELVPALPKDFKMPSDSYCFSKEEVVSAILTPEELKTVVDFAGTVVDPVKPTPVVRPPVVKPTPKPVPSPTTPVEPVEDNPEPKKVSGLTIPSKKYMDFEGGTVVDFDVIALQNGSTREEVMVDGVKHIKRSIPVFFRTGEYPDKKDKNGITFSMNEEEGKKAVKHFQEKLKGKAPIVISHKPTVLDDHNTASLVGLELKGDGTFSAAAQLPEWLDNFVVKQKKMGISARWGVDEEGNKVLVHGALVPDPRIEDAAVVADFNKNLYAEFEGNIPYNASPMAGDDTPSPEPDSDDDQQSKPLHGKELGQAIEEEIQMTLEDISKDPDRHASKYVGVLQKLLTMAQGLQGKEEQEDTDTSPNITTPNGQKDSTSRDFSKENEDLSVQNTSLKADVAKLKEENDNIRATSAATVARFAKKIEPADFDSTVFDLKQAAKDDRTHGTTDFAKGESRFTKMVKNLMGKETHPLMVSTVDLQILGGDRGADFEKTEKEQIERDRDINAARKIAGLPPKESKNGTNGTAHKN